MSQGYKVRIATKRPAETSSYGTQATSIANVIPALSADIRRTHERTPTEAVVGTAGSRDSVHVASRFQGPVSCELWYEGLEYLLLSAFGFECPTVYSGVWGAGSGGSPAPNDGTPTSYVHFFELDDDLHRVAWAAGERAAASGSGSDPTYWTASDKKVRTASLCVDDTVASEPYHLVDAAVNKLSLKASLRKVTIDFDVIGQRRVNVDSNETSWALPTNRNFAIFPQMRFYCGATGASLPSALAITEAEFNLENNLLADFESWSTGSVYDDTYISEPIRNDMRKVSLKVRFGRINTTVLDWLTNDTELNAVLEFVGPTVPGGDYLPFRFALIIPKLRVSKADFPIQGAGAIGGEAEFVIDKPAASAWTRTWITGTYLRGISVVKANEVGLVFINSRGSCFSRDRNTIALP